MPGVVAAFRELDSAVEAIAALKKNRFTDMTVFSPTPRHELDDAVAAPVSRVRLFTLIGGLAGVSFGYWIAI